jgi:hypothetical protein
MAPPFSSGGMPFPRVNGLGAFPFLSHLVNQTLYGGEVDSTPQHMVTVAYHQAGRYRYADGPGELEITP